MSLQDLIAREGNFEEWTDNNTASGYLCRIKRNSLGFWCGYVRIPKGHPAFDKDYDSINVDVHGGLTFGSSEPSGGFYWVGFDCGHAGDKMPYSLFSSALSSEVYRTKEYVINETNSLASQLKGLEN